MSIIWMLVVGLVVGAIAKLMMPGKDPGGIFVTMLLGVAGALVAGFLGQRVGMVSRRRACGSVRVHHRRHCFTCPLSPGGGTPRGIGADQAKARDAPSGLEQPILAAMSFQGSKASETAEKSCTTVSWIRFKWPNRIEA